jgi:phage shock protein C
MADPKRLYNSRTEKQLAGVCGGLADYIGIDPTLMRLIYIIGTIMTGFIPGIFVYFILAIIAPEEPEPAADDAD